MKKVISIIMCLCLVLCVGGILVACGEMDTTPTGENTVKLPVAYSINANGELIGTYKDQTTINLGSLINNIANGVQSITVNADGYYVINNVSTTIKEIQAPQPVSYVIDTNGNLIVTYSDRSTKNEGKFGQDAINTIETVAVSEDGYYVLNGIKTTIQAIPTYTVTFDTGFATKVDAQQVKEGYKVERPQIERTGYTFGGWYCNGEEWSFNTNVVMNDMTLTAQWTANQYTVSFINEKGDDPADLIVTYDGDVTLPIVAEVEGYTFDGWLVQNTHYSNGKWTTAEDVELTAQWTPKKYTITLDAAGGSVAKSSVEVSYDATYTLPIPTNEFGVFIGWLLDDEPITDDSGKALAKWQFNSNKTFTTSWTIHISSVEDLNSLSLYKNGYFELDIDLDLLDVEWTPVGTEAAPFTGKIDGKGHSISNLTIAQRNKYVGLFGYSKGTITNIILSDLSINIPAIDQDSYIGGFVGYNAGTVKDAALAGSITVNPHSSSYKSYTGGVTGYNTGNIENATNNASVAGINYVGGICGYNKGTLKQLANDGVISAETYGAGIVAYSTMGLSDCINTAQITSGAYTAGIVAFMESIQTSTTIQQCKNTGNIYSGSDAGGIVGYLSNSSRSIAIDKCANIGNISTSVVNGHIGGLAGFIYTIQITDSYNRGNINGADFAGGIIGYTFNGSISRCYSVGLVKGTTQNLARLGGIAGMFMYGTFNECYTNTQINGATIGGTINGNDTDSSRLSNCYYSGSGSNSTSYLTQGTLTAVRYDAEFYTTALFWSEDIWSFDGIALPTLKWEVAE